ncbi:hypothetical protein ATC00_19830 [Sinorhizobium americanum]|nr:hypothetical protein ATC00_19830 [Sinorhizobium americanum]
MNAQPQPPMIPEAAGRGRRRTLRHLVMSALSGTLAGTVAAGALMLLDIGSIGTLVERSTDPLLAAATVFAPFALIGTAAGTAIGLAPYFRKFRR